MLAAKNWASWSSSGACRSTGGVPDLTTAPPDVSGSVRMARPDKRYERTGPGEAGRVRALVAAGRSATSADMVCMANVQAKKIGGTHAARHRRNRSRSLSDLHVRPRGESPIQSVSGARRAAAAVSYGHEEAVSGCARRGCQAARAITDPLDRIQPFRG